MQRNRDLGALKQKGRGKLLSKAIKRDRTIRRVYSLFDGKFEKVEYSGSMNVGKNGDF